MLTFLSTWSTFLLKKSFVYLPRRVTKDQILLAVFHCLRLPVVPKKRHRRIEMKSPAESSPKSYRVRDFLPSVKPSYLSLILLLVCAMNLIRNESTNNRLLALEKQMMILSASFDQNGSPSNHDKTSELITDSVILARKTAESLERKKPYFLKGENHLKVMDLDCSRTAIYMFLWLYSHAVK